MDQKDVCYEPVATEDGQGTEHRNEIERRAPRKRLIDILSLCLVLEIFNVFAFVGIPYLLSAFNRPQSNTRNDYFALNQYNREWRFEFQKSYDPYNPAETKAWDDIYYSVSL
ncbi:hypothetical protein F5X97DRAFT_338462 [Nemania serpens]|nr:hypothetical protein F5X97DRAFT_338462 [Nemania serpens]